MRPVSSYPSCELPWGWLPALPVERCEHHRARPAVFRYLGRPLCAQCSRGFKPRGRTPA